jgi:hypothetical protein
VTLTLTSAGNGNCNAVSDAVTYTITPAPTANAGADQTLCSNNAIATLGGSFTVATGGIWSGGNGSFSPSTTNVNATYTPTAAEIANGNVTLILTTTGNGTCVAVTDQVQINYTPSPTANAGPDLSLCRNNAAVALGRIGDRCNRRYLERWRGLVHTEQHHAQRDLHADPYGTRCGYVDADLDHDRQW